MLSQETPFTSVKGPENSEYLHLRVHGLRDLLSASASLAFCLKQTWCGFFESGEMEWIPTPPFSAEPQFNVQHCLEVCIEILRVDRSRYYLPFVGGEHLNSGTKCIEGLRSSSDVND